MPGESTTREREDTMGRLAAAHLTTWAGGLFERITSDLDIDEARAAAERLAEKRADG